MYTDSIGDEFSVLPSFHFSVVRKNALPPTPAASRVKELLCSHSQVFTIFSSPTSSQLLVCQQCYHLFSFSCTLTPSAYLALQLFQLFSFLIFFFFKQTIPMQRGLNRPWTPRSLISFISALATFFPGKNSNDLHVKHPFSQESIALYSHTAFTVHNTLVLQAHRVKHNLLITHTH